MSSQAVLVDAEPGYLETSNGSRFDAVTHGLKAKTAVLSGEDPEEYRARVELYGVIVSIAGDGGCRINQAARSSGLDTERAMGVDGVLTA